MSNSHDSQNQNLDQNKKQHIELRPKKYVIPGMLQEPKRTYIKIDQKNKEKLCQLVMKEGLKIVACLLGIKYTTAKTIIFQKRRRENQEKVRESRDCGVKKLIANHIYKIRIISSSSQDIATVQDYTFQYVENCAQQACCSSSVSIQINI